MMVHESRLPKTMRPTPGSFLYPNTPPFFVPTEEFWTRFKRFVDAGITFIECGCADGYLLDMAGERGIQMTGIELFPRESTSVRVAPGDACNLTWSHTQWPLICRPDHSGWISDVFNACKSVGACALYVGLSRNYTRDILGHHARKIASKVGKDGENMFLVNPHSAPSQFKV